MLKPFPLLATYGFCQSLPDLSTACGHIAEVHCYDFGRHASLTRRELHAPACDHAEFLGCLRSRPATPLVIVTDAGQRHQGFRRRPYPGDAGNVHKGRGTPPDVSRESQTSFTQKLGVTRLHFKRCNQIANLVDFAHSFLFFNFAILISMSQIAAESVCGLVPIARLATVSNSSRISGVAPKTW
jgi:hypothetical protein